MYVLPTVKLKLDVNQAHVIHQAAKSAYEIVERHTDRKHIKNDTIMMAEYYQVISKQLTAHMFQHIGQPLKTYKLSLAISRSLHSRLQHTRSSYSSQSLLTMLDSKLTNIGYKPVQQLEISE